MANREQRRRTFTVGRPEDAPPQFDLQYEVDVTSEPEDGRSLDEVPDEERVWEQRTSTFRCVRRAPGGLVMDFLSVDENAMGMGIATIARFMEGVIDPRDRADWDHVIKSADVQVPIETLAEVATWLAGVYTARPT